MATSKETYAEWADQQERLALHYWLMDDRENAEACERMAITFRRRSK